jgi:hypothetical protein
VISRRKCLYLHRTTEDRKTRTNIHALSGIRTHDLSVEVIKAFALGRVHTDHVVATPVFTAVVAAATVPGTAELSLSRWTRLKKQYF